MTNANCQHLIPHRSHVALKHVGIIDAKLQGRDVYLQKTPDSSAAPPSTTADTMKALNAFQQVVVISRFFEKILFLMYFAGGRADIPSK